jgi:ribonuclease BN (tRNA processing enzyme)
MKIKLLGTGTPTPSLKAASSGYLLTIGDDVIVLDHGPGAHHRLMEAGYRSTQVTHFFCTHLHYDHCMEYPRLVLQRWDMGAGLIPELQVFGPRPILRMTEQLFAPDGVYGPDIAARCNHQGSIDIYEGRGGKLPRLPPAPLVREVAAGDVVKGKDWTVSIANTWHAQPYLECLAYRFNSDKGSLCYTGDSGGVCDTVVELARGCDVLIHMCHYFTGTEPTPEYRRMCGNHIDVAHVAREAGVKMVVLTHKLEQIEQPGVHERMIREMSAIYDGDIIWGIDLMDVPLDGVKLTRME